jgi:hypothetical protein
MGVVRWLLIFMFQIHCICLLKLSVLARLLPVLLSSHKMVVNLRNCVGFILELNYSAPPLVMTA